MSSLDGSIFTTRILLDFSEKAAENLFVFIGEPQEVSNLSEGNRGIIPIDFELLAQSANVGPFVGFTNPRKIIRDFTSGIS